MTTKGGDRAVRSGGTAAAGRSLRPLGGVLAAMAVSLTGTRISAIALPWFVLVSTGSASQTGMVAFCELGPYVAVKAASGPVLDRIGPRRVSWTTDLVSASAAAAVPALHVLGSLHFWLLLVLVAVIGGARGPGDLGKEIMMPEAAERGGVPLERAAGLSGVTERLAATAGPAVGGAVVALVGPLAALVVNATAFTLGSVIVGCTLPRGMGRGAPPEPAAGEDQPAGYWRRFGEAAAFLRGDRLLLAILVVVGVTNLLAAAFSTVLVPVWGHESGHGPAGIGLVLGTSAVAAVCGSLVATAVAHRLPRRMVFFTGFFVAGAPGFLILAVDVPLWVVLAVFAVRGFGSGFLNPIIVAVVYERIPRPMLGRVGALGDSLAWVGMPFGGLAGGAAVAAVGLAPALVVCGVAYFLTTTLAGLHPQWREMDSNPRRRGRSPDDAAALR